MHFCVCMYLTASNQPDQPSFSRPRYGLRFDRNAFSERGFCLNFCCFDYRVRDPPVEVQPLQRCCVCSRCCGYLAYHHACTVHVGRGDTIVASMHVGFVQAGSSLQWSKRIACNRRFSLVYIWTPLCTTLRMRIVAISLLNVRLQNAGGVNCNVQNVFVRVRCVWTSACSTRTMRMLRIGKCRCSSLYYCLQASVIYMSAFPCISPCE